MTQSSYAALFTETSIQTLLLLYSDTSEGVPADELLNWVENSNGAPSATAMVRDGHVASRDREDDRLGFARRHRNLPHLLLEP